MLEFMGFSDNIDTCPNGTRVNNRYKMHNFIKFLNYNEIKFEQSKL